MVTRFYLLRLENGHAFSAPLRFISESRLNYSEQRISLILGIFFGLTGLAAVISTLGALSLRDPAYGWYAIFVTLMGLSQACVSGIAGLALLGVLAAGLNLATNTALLSMRFLARHGMQLATALHLPIVLVVLMLRSQQRRENIRRIQGLDRVDPATGLINGHVFGARLLRMIARSVRLRHQSAVMLIDLVNIDQIQREYGRHAAQELPLRLAARLLSTAREIDSAARLSERRFGMLVEGPFNAEDAATLGPRIVARCLMP